MVDRDTELKVLWTSTCSTTQFWCRSNIVRMPWTIVSHPWQIVTPNEWGLKCSTKASLNWITNVQTTMDYVTLLIMIRHMLLDCFSNVRSHDVESKHNKGGTWPWTMCPHTLKKKLKPLVESFGTK
jgi:hypothetical protein